MAWSNENKRENVGPETKKTVAVIVAQEAHVLELLLALNNFRKLLWCSENGLKSIEKPNGGIEIASESTERQSKSLENSAKSSKTK